MYICSSAFHRTKPSAEQSAESNNSPYTAYGKRTPTISNATTGGNTISYGLPDTIAKPWGKTAKIRWNTTSTVKNRRRRFIRDTKGDAAFSPKKTRVNKNLVLLDNEDKPRFFCSDHVLMQDGKPVGFDPSDPEHRPQSAALAEHYGDWNQPLPKPECERNILNVLVNPTPEEPTQVGFYVTQDRKYVLTYSPWTGWKHSRLDGTANDALPWNGQSELSTDDWRLVVDNLGKENLPLIPLGNLFTEEEV